MVALIIGGDREERRQTTRTREMDDTSEDETQQPANARIHSMTGVDHETSNGFGHNELMVALEGIGFGRGHRSCNSARLDKIRNVHSVDPESFPHTPPPSTRSC